MRHILRLLAILLFTSPAFAQTPQSLLGYLPSSYPSGSSGGGGGTTNAPINLSFSNVYTGTTAPANGALWIQQTVSGMSSDAAAFALNNWTTTDSVTGSSRSAFSILYSGAQATATMSISLDGILTLEAPQGTVVAQFDFANLDTTLTLLTADINTVTGFAATLIAAGNTNSQLLNTITEQDVKTATYTVLYYFSTLKDVTLNDSLVSGWGGSRIGLDNSVILKAAGAGGTQNLVAEYSRAFFNGDTGGTSAAPVGAGAGIIPGCIISTAMVGWLNGCGGIEVDIVTRDNTTNGSEILYGVNVSKYIADALRHGLQGRSQDIGYRLSANLEGGYGWLVGLGNGANAPWPWDVTKGQILYTPGQFGNLTVGPYSGQPRNQMLGGINIEEAVFLTCAFKSAGICIDNAGQVGWGQAQLGISGANATVGVPGSTVTAVAIHTAGTGYPVGPTTQTYPITNGVDGVFQVRTAATGIPAAITMEVPPIVYGATPCTSNCPLTVRGKNFGAGLTVDFTWQPPGNLLLGNSTADLLTTATTGFPTAPTMAGRPTGAAGGAAGNAPYVIDKTNHQICWNETGTTWKCAAGT